MQRLTTQNSPVYGLPSSRDVVERQLIDLFQAILERPIKPDDDFFDLGGDSLKALQLVARANDLGIKIEVEHIFRRPSAARLAQAAWEGVSSGRPVAPIGKTEYALTPAQAFFFDLNLSFPDYFNQAQLFEAMEKIDPAILEAASQEVLAHHDALRLRFRNNGQSWVQHVAPTEPANLVEVVDVSSSTEMASWLLFRSHAEKLHGSINLERGPLCRLLIATGLPHGRSLVLIVAHHLVVDGFSWRIILEDIEAAYRALEQGSKPRLLSHGASFHEWSDFLTAYASSADFDCDLQYWLSKEWRDTPLCQLDRAGPDLEWARFDYHYSLDQCATHNLLTEGPRAGNVEVTDLLLACAARAAAGNVEGNEILIDVAHHGRIAPVAGAPNVSRTVGWFSTFFPVCLAASGQKDLTAAAQDVRTQLNEIPNRGFTFGVMRHLVKKHHLPKKFFGIPRPGFLLTNAGHFSSAFSTAPLLRWVGAADVVLPSNADFDEIRGRIHHPMNARMHEIVFSHQVSHERLMLRTTFSNTRHDARQARSFADAHIENLRSLAKVQGNAAA